MIIIIMILQIAGIGEYSSEGEFCEAWNKKENNKIIIIIQKSTNDDDTRWLFLFFVLSVGESKVNSKLNDK